MTWQAVASVDDLKARGKLCVNVAGLGLLLVWQEEQIYAVENRCSHASKPLDQGKVERGVIRCPYHGATFDLETGKPLSPPAFKGIRCFHTRISGNIIEADI
ncbi:MAG: Rieske (2Fe-2S) protein [Ketobacteraceae bacterium]|nr:Rieske (2Fe-2S) protein [Ketobacteraceae bacterium]